MDASRLRRTSYCPSCSNEILEGIKTCPTCGALLQLEAAMAALKSAGLRKASPGISAVRNNPVPALIWILSVIPLLIVSPLLAVGLVGFTGVSKGEQRSWIYTIAAINLAISLLFWWWAGSQLFEQLAAWIAWLQSQPPSHSAGSLGI